VSAPKYSLSEWLASSTDAATVTPVAAHPQPPDQIPQSPNNRNNKERKQRIRQGVHRGALPFFFWGIHQGEECSFARDIFVSRDK